MNLKEKRAAALAKGNAIVDGAKAAGTELSAEQAEAVATIVAEIRTLDESIAKAGEAAAILGKLDAIADESAEAASETGSADGKGFLNVSAKSFAKLGRRAAQGMIAGGPDDDFLDSHFGAKGRSLARRSFGTKALLPSGETAVSVTVSPNIVTNARPLSELLATIPVVKQSSPVFRFLRQTARTNNAAVVKSGDTKPTSVYGLTPVEGELKVIAHLSEGIDKYSLEDVTNLEQFVTDEMIYGLYRALENQVLNGVGEVTGPPAKNELTGLLNTSGIQTQAFVTDLLTTTRKAVTAVESIGHTAGTFVLSPADWETLELARTETAGSLELGGPVDRAKRTLWGVNIAICTALPAKTAVLLDPTALAVDTDANVELKWDSSGDNFDKNLMRARVESRYHLSVYQPLGVVRISTAA